MLIKIKKIVMEPDLRANDRFLSLEYNFTQLFVFPRK